MTDLELGNLMFNTNKNQTYHCPNWVVALLKDIEDTLERVMWNIDHKEFDSPFGNTGNRYCNEVFEVQAYSWDDEESQDYNFKCGDIEISWYKYLGRDTTVNGEYDEKTYINMYNRCKESLFKIDMKTFEELLDNE